MLRIAAELAGKCLQWVISRNTQSEDKFSALGRIASVTLAVAKTPRASHFDGSWMGRARPLCPDISDVNFLWNLDGIVNLDTKIAHGAVNFAMSKQKLYGSQVTRPTVDQSCFGPAKGMRSKL